MKEAVFHAKAKDAIREFPREVRHALGIAILDLQRGINLKMPLSKPMSIIAKGAYELRISESDGTYRVFYYAKSSYSILIFHAFKKKTEKTPLLMITLAQKRLREMLNEN